MNRYKFLFFLSLISCAALAQDSLTVTWSRGRGPSAIASTPAYKWLKDSRLVLYDRRVPEGERTLEVLDPSTLKRFPLVDAKKALASLTPMLGSSVPKTLPFPVDIDGAGVRAVYLFSGDIFLLDCASSTFQRVTATPGEEKCVGLSPDGATVSFVRSNNLYVYDIASAKESGMTSDGTDSLLNGTLSWVYWEEVFGRHDSGYWWSPDSKAIAYFQTDESGVSKQHYVDVTPWTPRVITQRYPKVGEKNPAVRVGVVEISSGTTTWMQPGVSGAEYIVRAEWLPDSRRLSIETLNRAQTKLDLVFAARSTGIAEHILAETDSAWVNVLDDMFFLNDGKRFIWPSEKTGYEHLYMMGIDGTPGQQITRGAWTIRAAGGEVAWIKGGVVGIDEKNEFIYFTALEKSSIERHLYRVKFDGSGFKRLSNTDGTHSVSFSPNCEFYVDQYSNASTPPALTLYHKDGTEVARLASPRREMLTKLNLRYPEALTIPARDGFRMPAQILKPATLEPGKKYPVIFSVYSGPSAPVVADAWGRDIYWDNLLVKNGYIVVRCDNRSASGISKILETSVVNRLSGDGERDDLVDAARWVKRLPYVDSARIGMWGWSGGGSCTILMMTRSTEFKAGIAVAGVTDFRFYDTKWAEQVMKTLETNREGYEENSHLKHAKDLHGKLMLVHGTYDDNVHIQNTWAFVNELIKADKLFEMMIYPMRMHGISDRPAQIHLYNTMLDFWKRNL